MITDQSSIQEYLHDLQALAERVYKGTQPKSDLLNFITNAQERLHSTEPALQPFFLGEQCFYQGDYENALKNYLKAKELPFSQFFCFRASAYIANQRSNGEQAIKFARKANALKAGDPAIMAILEELKERYGFREQLSSEDEQEALFDSTRSSASPMGNSGFPPADPEIHRQLDIANQYKLDLMNTAEKALELRIQNFQRRRAQQLSQYVKRSRSRPKLDDYCLYVFNGWEQQPAKAQPFDEREEENWGYFFLNSQMRSPSCGFYLRWNGKGIAINPGRRFLDCFHRSGLHIADIDMVIVTQTDSDSYADVQQIYELNYQLNKISSELQIIHYYLNHAAHLELSPGLKPNFKQERHAIHSLELFVDSPEVERVELTPDISLNYFPTSTKEALSHHQMEGGGGKRRNYSPLGMRLDMRFSHGEQKKTVKMGYLSGTPWSPLLGHHLGYCDLLFTGFGNTHLNDFGKLNYNESCLGYFGTYSLAEEVKPRLLFCCEFDGREGDIRLEVSRKIRQELTNPLVVLPADNGLFIDLNNLQIRCSVSSDLVEPSQIRVVKSGDAFSTLLYVSPNCLLES